MKGIWHAVLAVLLTLVMLAAGFLAPAVMERMLERKSNEAQIIPSEPASYLTSKEDKINLFAMLNGDMENLSVTELEEGNVYDKETAVAQAFGLLIEFCENCGFTETLEALTTGERFIEARAYFYLYSDQTTPHSALIWRVDLSLEAGYEVHITFDDETGSLLGIEMPLLEATNDPDAIDAIKDYDMLLDLTDLCAMGYCSLTDVQFDVGYDLIEDEELEPDDSICYRFFFTVTSPTAVRSIYDKKSIVQGRWSQQADGGLYLSMMPGLFDTQQENAAEEGWNQTDKRDALKIAQCLTYGTYSAVYVPDDEDNAVKDDSAARMEAYIQGIAAQ